MPIEEVPLYHPPMRSRASTSSSSLQVTEQLLEPGAHEALVALVAEPPPAPPPEPLAPDWVPVVDENGA